MKKIGLALGGGGAKGLAHLGILEVLAEEDIHFDVIAGTSAGALVGAVYASGTLHKLIDEVKRLRLVDVTRLLSPTLSTTGFFSGNNALQMFEEWFSAPEIENLNKTFGAVACDLQSEESVLLDKGELRKAVRASIAIPGLFTPVHHNDQLLVDGGVLEPLPVKRVQEMGGKLVLAVDLFGEKPHLHAASERQKSGALQYLKKLSRRETCEADGLKIETNIMEILFTTFAVAQRKLTKEALEEYRPSVVIRPSVLKFGFLDFHKAEELIEIGRQAAQTEVENIRRAIREVK